MERLRYPIDEAASLLGKSRRGLEHDVMLGKLPVVRDGRRIFITADALRRYAGQDNPTVVAMRKAAANAA